MTHESLAESVGTSRGQIINLEKGARRLTDTWITRLANALGVPKEEIIAEPRLVPVIGTIGAGAEVFPIDDYPLVRPERMAEHVHPADGMDYVSAPPDGPVQGVVALRVTGESMMPFLEDGCIVYYNQRIDGDCSSLIGGLCVVMLKDGRALLKRLKRGREYGKYDLISYNASIMENVEVEWCAKVTFIKPA